MTIDFLVLGGGAAGASAAFFLADHGRVTVLEKEDAPGYHSTGRSAALFTQNYGNAAIRALANASRPFFDAPPQGFGEHPLLHPRGALMVAPPGDGELFARELAEGMRHAPGLRQVDVAEALRLSPVLRPEWIGYALYEPGAMDMDVHAIHHGYLRGFRAKGGQLVCSAETRSIERRQGQWHVVTSAGSFAAPILVNAAGAWADEVAKLAGITPVGLVPKRRTAATIDPPDGVATAHWPMVMEIAESFYYKPESGRILISPADETPMPPCDVQPDELDIAIVAERIEAATTLKIRRIHRKWAGLRSFVRDKTPVVGPAPDAEGFIWLAGQGGYGIMTSPAMGRVATALITTGALPADLTTLGLAAATLLPDRLVGKTPAGAA